MSYPPPAKSLKHEGKLALTPHLRFPEFRNAAAWEEQTLSFACQMQAGKFVSASEIKEQNTQGLYPCYGGNGLRGYTATFTHLGKYSLIGRQGALCGNVKVGIGQFHATEHAVVVTPKNGIKGDWLFYLLDLLNLNRFATGQAQPGLSVDVLETLSIAIPNQELEQQKIADCLCSVDELIAAQARKLDALKTHKKGLMQQLFPREGETQPRLRFPEFRNAEEWSKERLGSLCFRIMDGTHFSPKSKGGPRPYLTSKNIKDGSIDLSNLSYISEEEHLEIYNKCPVKLHDVLLTKDGANTGNCALNNLEYEFSLLSSVAVLRSDPSKLCQEFLFQSLLSDSVQSLISDSMSGQAITRITLTKIGGFVISVTSLGEQQRIAEFLASLDDLVATQTQKLDALKTHKKGLMQQLFPSPEVVEA